MRQHNRVEVGFADFLLEIQTEIFYQILGRGTCIQYLHFNNSSIVNYWKFQIFSFMSTA